MAMLRSQEEVSAQTAYAAEESDAEDSALSHPAAADSSKHTLL